MPSPEMLRLQQEVEETRGVVNSAIALLGGLSQYIRDHAEDPAALTAFADSLDAQQGDLAGAVAANQPPA